MTTAPIHTTLQRFSDAANARGLDKPRLIRAHRRRVEAPPREGRDFYAPALAAVRNGLLSGEIERHLAELLTQCRPGQREHFAEFGAGLIRLIHRFKVVGIAPAPRGLWRQGDLEVNITGLFGVQLASGQREAWVLHKRAPRLEAHAADIPLYVADAFVRATDGAVAVRLVDVRRARAYMIRTDQERAALEHLAQAEAEAYVALWRASA